MTKLLPTIHNWDRRPCKGLRNHVITKIFTPLSSWKCWLPNEKLTKVHLKGQQELLLLQTAAEILAGKNGQQTQEKCLEVLCKVNYTCLGLNMKECSRTQNEKLMKIHLKGQQELLLLQTAAEILAGKNGQQTHELFRLLEVLRKESINY